MPQAAINNWKGSSNNFLMDLSLWRNNQQHNCTSLNRPKRCQLPVWAPIFMIKEPNWYDFSTNWLNEPLIESQLKRVTERWGACAPFSGARRKVTSERRFQMYRYNSVKKSQLFLLLPVVASVVWSGFKKKSAPFKTEFHHSSSLINNE